MKTKTKTMTCGHCKGTGVVVVPSRVPWACPKCGATPSKHGKGGDEKCDYTRDRGGGCYGFLCECHDPGDSQDHGQTSDDPCPAANCYHCGWGGEMPRDALRKGSK